MFAHLLSLTGGRIRSSTRSGHLVALLAGGLTTLALAPFDIWPLALLSIALLYAGLKDLTPRQALWRGWWYGFGLFGCGTSWIYVSIHDFGGASPPLAIALMLLFTAAIAFFCALPTWVWARWLRRNQHPALDALGFAALWVVQDQFRSWFLTGFPWLYAGYSQLEGPLQALAPIGGVWLLSGVLALSAALLVNSCALWRQPGYRGPAILGSLLAVWLLVPGLLQDVRWTRPKGEPLQVAVIQGNVSQQMKWDAERLEQQLRLYQDLTLASRPSDLIVWPETAVPLFQDRAHAYLTYMARAIEPRNSALITGLPIRQPELEGGAMRFYNGITVRGNGHGDYLKQKLVPFGEYVPLQDLLRGLISFFDLPMSNFARGPAQQAPLQARGYAVAPYICYEVVYPDFAARLAAQSDLLLTISNDAWFGHSIGPLQHLQMARMRALESGRWMIRGTNNGITALIDPQGRISAELPSFEQATLYGTVTPMQGQTPFLLWRGTPLTLACLLMLVWTGWQRNRTQGYSQG